MTIDLTKNTTAFGLMSKEEREALEALPYWRIDVYTTDGTWTQMRHKPFFRNNGIYRQRPTPPLIVDPDLWRHLPKEANWIAGDKSGRASYYEEEPIHSESGGNYWFSKCGECKSFLGNWPSITFTDPERWEEAIVKRPEGV